MCTITNQIQPQTNMVVSIVCASGALDEVFIELDTTKVPVQSYDYLEGKWVDTKYMSANIIRALEDTTKPIFVDIIWEKS